MTLCLPYYMNAGMLKLQFARIRRLPGDLLGRLAVVVVDDGSPNGEAQGEPIGCPLTIFRIGVDVRWNQDAARNIAVAESDTPWLLLTDIDHLVPEGTWRRLMTEKLQKKYCYKFSRTTLEPIGVETPYKEHPNSWVMSRGLWDAVGGYDERFAGFYGTDADFRDRVLAVAHRIVQLPEHIIRVPRETLPDASTTTYARKSPEDGPNLRRIKGERNALGDWRPLTLTFPYTKIYQSQ